MTHEEKEREAFEARLDELIEQVSSWAYEAGYSRSMLGYCKYESGQAKAAKENLKALVIREISGRAALRAESEPVGKKLTEDQMGIGYDRRIGDIIWFKSIPPSALLYTAPQPLPKPRAEDVPA